eukprot:SAG31_NODE_44732_length_261_cov_1.265432_1_plen_36_part_01
MNGTVCAFVAAMTSMGVTHIHFSARIGTLSGVIVRH